MLLRKALFLGLALFSAGSFACHCPKGGPGENPNLPSAWHEFDIFGKEKIFLAHFAAFHSIHGYQVIVEVELDPESADKYRASSHLRARLSPTMKGKDGATIQDRLEDWKLPNMMVAGKRFHAEIHAGADAVAPDVMVTVKRVIHFKMYQDDEPRPKELPYLLFGGPAEAFLMHVNTRFPDFDQVLAVEVRTESGEDAPIPESQPVVTKDESYLILGPVYSFPGTDNEPKKKIDAGKVTYVFEPLKVGDEATGVSVLAKGKLRFKVKTQLRYNFVDRDY